MPWKLGDPDEPTELLRVRVPKSVKDWLKAQPGGISKAIRRLVKEARWDEAKRPTRD